jgi:signal peptidase II
VYPPAPTIGGMARIPTENFRSPVSLALFFGTTVVGLVLDQVVKVWAFNALADGSTYRFIPGLLHFQITENRGAVFGIGQGMRFFFIAVSAGAILFLTSMFAYAGRRQRGYMFLLGMLLAGVLGNLYDRAVLGFVRDMLHGLPGWHWPGTWVVPGIDYPAAGRDVFPWIFNVADSFLVVGVTILFVRGLFHGEEKSGEANAGAEAAGKPAET